MTGEATAPSDRHDALRLVKNTHVDTHRHACIAVSAVYATEPRYY